jgi:hypothetical protein
MQKKTTASASISMVLLCLFAFLSVSAAGQIVGQKDSLPPLSVDKLQHIFDAVDVDSIVVSAPRFDVQEFIRMVEKDETFYNAFANLRHISYKAHNEVRCYTRGGRALASYTSKTTQNVDTADCRTMTREDEKTTGRYYERGKGNQTPRYYTAKMYEKLFFTYGRICHREVLRQEALNRRKKTPRKRYGAPYHGA